MFLLENREMAEEAEEAEGAEEADASTCFPPTLCYSSATGAKEA